MRISKGLTGITAAVMMILLILDSKTAFTSTQDGIQMCIKTVIPSLFPFLILSGIITSVLSGGKAIFLHPLGKLCGIPAGSETLLLMGLLGGYPVGAQCIFQAYQSGRLEKTEAERMLGFCNNAGPAFIFGITISVFGSPLTGWILWGIQILSCLITGWILPGSISSQSMHGKNENRSIPEILTQSVRTMSIICGWVIAAKVVIGFADRWFLWLLPKPLCVLLKGFLELSNGCLALTDIASLGVRFILCSVILTFGGLCVWMQIFSVTGGLAKRNFIWGKLIQTLISLFLAVAICLLLYPEAVASGSSVAFAIGAMVVILVVMKKVVAKKRKVLYTV